MPQQAELEIKGAVRASSACSFGEPKRTGESLHMRILDPLHDPVWDDLIATHGDADCFHTSAWAKVLHRTYKHQPFYVQFSSGRRLAALVAFMEVRSPFTGRRGVSLPFSDACEPLIFDPEATTPVREALVRLGGERRWRYLEIRAGKSLQLAKTPVTQFYGHTLDLRCGTQELITRFASSVRRAIRKAESSGVTVLILSKRQAVLDFYQLHVQTRRRHGLPPQSASFFMNIHDHILRSGLGFIVLAQRRSRAIAGAMFFRFGKNALYKYAASDKRFQQFRANNLVMWRGIQALVDVGAENLSLGRTDCGNGGLRRFKLSWGAKEETLSYFRVDATGRQCLAAAGEDYTLHRRIFGSLPLLFNRLAGSMIYPHLD